MRSDSSRSVDFEKNRIKAWEKVVKTFNLNWHLVNNHHRGPLKAPNNLKTDMKNTYNCTLVAILKIIFLIICETNENLTAESRPEILQQSINDLFLVLTVKLK